MGGKRLSIVDLVHSKRCLSTPIALHECLCRLDNRRSQFDVVGFSVSSSGKEKLTKGRSGILYVLLDEVR
jgi:hypothetical protein